MLFAFAYLLLRRLVQLVADSPNDLKGEVEFSSFAISQPSSNDRWASRDFAAGIGCSSQR